MKKINVLMLTVLVLFSGFFSSCKKDTTEATFDFIGSDPYISADKTVSAGSTIQFKWTISSPTSMATFDISKNDALVAGWGNKAIPSASKSTYTDEASLTADANAGTYVYAFTAYDKDGVEIISKSITITVTAAAGNITSLPARTFGSGTVDSYYDVETNTVYNYSGASAAAVKPTIDFVYDTDKVWATSTLTSSTGATFTDVTATITTAQFDAATTDALFASLTNTATSVTAANNKVIAFTLKSGKKGLMKITAFTAGTNGSITFVIKVQQ